VLSPGGKKGFPAASRGLHRSLIGKTLKCLLAFREDAELLEWHDNWVGFEGGGLCGGEGEGVFSDRRTLCTHRIAGSTNRIRRENRGRVSQGRFCVEAGDFMIKAEDGGRNRRDGGDLVFVALRLGNPSGGNFSVEKGDWLREDQQGVGEVASISSRKKGLK